MKTNINRRQFDRFTVEPMYTPIAVRAEGSDAFDIEGHAYDISEGGARFELDRALKPGSSIAMQITLPATATSDLEPRRVHVFANVIWIEDEDQPGPVRTAAVFTHFARTADRTRLLRQISTGRFKMAA